MIIYELITWLIIQLGKIRYWCLQTVYEWNGFVYREDRDKINLIEGHNLNWKRAGFRFECCDCGLTHWLFFEKGFEMESQPLHCIPIRPKNYKYKLR